MKQLAVAALALLVGLGIGCVSFGLEDRRFRCTSQPEICDDGMLCGADGYCAPASATGDARSDAALADATQDDGAAGEVCGNNADDDGDGDVDCADDECGGMGTCGPGCVCQTPGVPKETNCSDGIDNDKRDGFDCDDPDCPQCMGTMCCPNGRCMPTCS